MGIAGRSCAGEALMGTRAEVAEAAATSNATSPTGEVRRRVQSRSPT